MVFVGHEITSEGVRFSSDKLSGVELIPLPITKGNLKTFVGLANYFRDHVKNHSNLSQPFNVLLPSYNRTQKNHTLVWTEELQKAFYIFRDAVANCPMLFFINNDEWEVGLGTDASDYGKGGFLSKSTLLMRKKFRSNLLANH